MKSVNEQLRIILKGVDTIANEEDLKRKLTNAVEQNKPLTVKLGLDPSASDIHLGHAVVLRKIRQLQDLGHEAVIIIGDFTGRIGDPTGRTNKRNALSKEQVEYNARTYCEQIVKILDVKKTKILFNSEWLSKLNFEEVLELATTTTVARMLEREDFKTRYHQNIAIGLHEFFYPLMQAYDSVEIHADIELGGLDQTFNVLMGRTLQKIKGQEPQVAIFMPILEGLDGVNKMSKSLNNYIGVGEPANVMFKKLMEIPDSLILKFYELATDEYPDQIKVIKEQLENGINPKDIKIQLALIITRLYHDEDNTQKALQYFRDVFEQNKIPKDIPTLVIDCEKDMLEDVVELLVEEKLVASKSEFRRLIKQGGIKINQERIEDMDILLACEDIIQIGKKKFVKIIK